jgi:bifunctional UDP-N-acetylglucosamine pyrophosphorylase/glucosamine-1-phosphate N-acetyltransferase
MRAIIILAAGNSKRMQSSLSKVLHPLAGQPVLQYVLDATNTLVPAQTIVVVPETLNNHPILAPYTQIVQTKALGTGHAVQVALPLLNDSVEEVFIVCGDTPLITPESLNAFSKVPEPLALMAMPVETGTSYGRVVFVGFCGLR